MKKTRFTIILEIVTGRRKENLENQTENRRKNIKSSFDTK